MLIIYSSICLACCYAQNENDKKIPKILVLIIANDRYSYYVEEQKIWRSYMHRDVEHVESYFIKGDPKIETEYQIVGDIIYSKTVENFRPGILNKTILSLECMMGRLDEFDYVIRTNLSSFYYFPRLLNFLASAPKSHYYSGWIDGHWVSGAGIIMSCDLAKMLVLNKMTFLNNLGADDVEIADFFIKNQIYPIPSGRMDLTSLDRWLYYKDKIPEDIYHFRLKNIKSRRATNEIYLQKELVKMFYSDIQ